MSDEWAKKNRARKTDYARRWREANRDKSRAATRKWCAANKERCLQATYDWQKRNPESLKAAQAKYRERHRERRLAGLRAAALVRKYQMTVDEFDQLSRSQGNACAICSRPRKLVVDHCHITGRVRGLLCRSCNSALGVFGDNAGGLEKAIEYLNATTVVEEPVSA